MRGFQFIFIGLLLTSCATQSVQEEPLYFAANPTRSAPFIPHTENKPLKSYLAMNLPYEDFSPLLQNLESRLKTTLKNRGEAHITVITPPEYDKISSKVKISEINTIAEKLGIQTVPYKLLCIGRVEKTLDQKSESAYFAVVESEKLFEIRKKIQDLYIQRGGKAGEFNAELFFPHATLGYTLRDLHYEDGVKKDASSCVFQIKERPTTP